jgi:syndecan 4
LFLFNQDSKQCHHDKKIYNENETWTIDHCTTCTCRSGLVDCAMVQCPTYTHCGYMYKPENECCPKCGGLLFNLLF